MIEIPKNLYIGEGEIRVCYEHPKNKNLCIKIPKPQVTELYTNKEILYFLKIKKRNKLEYSYPFYSDFHEEISTNLGKGQVFDLVRDEATGEVSKTLEYYFENETTFNKNVFVEALLVLKKHMIKHKIFTRDLRSRNICCKVLEDNTIQLIIIDGIGHRDFFPLADWFEHFAKKKVERSFFKAKFKI